MQTMLEAWWRRPQVARRALDAAIVLVCLGLTVLAVKTPWSPLPRWVIATAGTLGSGTAAPIAIRSGERPPAVIVLTTFDTDDDVFQALDAGAAGFLLKDTPPQELMRAIRVAASGDAMLSPGVTRRLIGRVTAEDRTPRRAALDRLDPLTERERDVLIEIGRGLANSDIARRLHLSEATVKTRISHLFEKLSATNRVQLAIAVFRAGLVD
jgi:DNA-binding NarL/FixJ family response regulator